MRHALPTDLDPVEPLLARLRALPTLSEKSRGVFYRKGRAFLHFHADPSGLFADVRQGSVFVRLKVDDDAGAAELLAMAENEVGAAN